MDSAPNHAWDHDPIAMMIQHNLTVLFDHYFPQGFLQVHDFEQQFCDTFGTSLVCKLEVCKMLVLTEALTQSQSNWFMTGIVIPGDHEVIK